MFIPQGPARRGDQLLRESARTVARFDARPYHPPEGLGKDHDPPHMAEAPPIGQ